MTSMLNTQRPFKDAVVSGTSELCKLITKANLGKLCAYRGQLAASIDGAGINSVAAASFLGAVAISGRSGKSDWFNCGQPMTFQENPGFCGSNYEMKSNNNKYWDRLPGGG
ncbi:uncharacterized protein LOC120427792 [Culex pipiens pallens]|uniref:uncharacterized protein LOC120427792 n=1 Tax=Culex pipiens pallens TaxID=42434 RepID=UPI001954AC62|nr:uncharacterized protein LOC120427792 [Culex pipiens pallens]